MTAAHVWTGILGLLMLVTLAPAVTIWLAAVSQQPFKTAGLQWLTLALLLVSLYKIVIFYRGQPGLLPVHTSRTGFLVFLIVALLHFAGSVLHIYALYWGSAIALMASLGWAMFGYGFFKRHLNWFLFALFLLPKMPLDLYTGISIPLQMVSTAMTVNMAKWFIPITHSGNIFLVNNHAFEVTVACSGLYTWIGFLFAGLLWLLFETFSYRRLLLILASAPLLALTTNSLRLFITALTAYHGSADDALAIHTNLEYILFPLGLLAMAWLGRVCRV